MPYSPSFWAPFLLPIVFVAAAGCHRPVNTVPAPVTPQDPVRHYELDIPDALDVRGVSFDATTFGDVGGNELGLSTQVGGRAFLKVYAVHRRTGQQYLLIYEDIARRKAPVQVIRFRPVPESAIIIPDSL